MYVCLDSRVGLRLECVGLLSLRHTRRFLVLLPVRSLPWRCCLLRRRAPWQPAAAAAAAAGERASEGGSAKIGKRTAPLRFARLVI